MGVDDAAHSDMPVLTWPDGVAVEWAMEGRTGIKSILGASLGMAIGVACGAIFRSWWVGVGSAVAGVGAVIWLDESLRRRPVIRGVRRQLRERTVSEDAWGPDPTRREVARAVCQAAAETTKWPNDRFVPGDSLRIVLFDDWDGMNCLDLAYRVKERTGRQWHWQGRRLETMSDLVESFIPQGDRALKNDAA